MCDIKKDWGCSFFMEKRLKWRWFSHRDVGGGFGGVSIMAGSQQSLELAEVRILTGSTLQTYSLTCSFNKHQLID